jgi:hypothetical protein
MGNTLTVKKNKWGKFSGLEQVPVIWAYILILFIDNSVVLQFNIALVWNQFMLVVINSEFVTFYVEIQISYQDSTVPYRKWNNGMKKLKCCHMPFYIHYVPVFIKVLSCAYVYSLCSCVHQSVVMCLCIFIMPLCSSKCCHVPMHIHYVPVFIKVLSCAYVYSLCSCVYQCVVICLCIFIMFLCLSVLSCAYVYSLCSCVYQSVIICLCILIVFLFSSCLFIGWWSTFNIISVIWWQSVLLVEETRGPGVNHWLAVSHWQIKTNVYYNLPYLHYFWFVQ